MAVLLSRCQHINDNRSLRGSRPNIILVMTDDQGYGDLSCTGNPDLQTPHIDSLYTMSTRFTDFHVSPACSPTRAAIMSGRHEFKNGVTHTTRERERMSLATTTIAEVLQDAGYETGIFGKWHLGDEEEYQPNNRGFNEIFIHGGGAIGDRQNCSCSDYPTNRETRYFNPVVRHNNKLVKTTGFCTDIFFQQALGWIKQKNREKQPFFAFITPNAPHGPMIAPDNYTKRFLDEGFSEEIAGRYGMIENIDDNMGMLMNKMKTWDLYDNTLLIFMTDNGGLWQALGMAGSRKGRIHPNYGAGFKSGKMSPYEGGTNVPAFWYWKGILGEGIDIRVLTAHIDLFRTFTDLAGIDLPGGIQELDGRSLLPLLENPDAEWPDRYLFVHVGRWPRSATAEERKFKYDYKNLHAFREGFAVRTEKWRFVNDQYLYDIENDPIERYNVASEHPEVVNELRTAYDKWWEETLPFMVNENVPISSIIPADIRYYNQLEKEGIPDWEKPEL